MTEALRETEQKYRVPEGTELPDLTVDGVAAVTDGGRQTLPAVYYDTADGRLAAAGVTLRRRTGGDAAGWHLKLPVAPHVRDEIREPLADAPPATLLALTRSRTRGAALVPVMDLLSERDVRHLRAEDGTLLAEVSLDRVHAARPDGRTASWTEVEAELAEGPPALLDRLDKRLRKAGLRPSPFPSKLQRALEETAPATARTAAPAAPGDTVGDLVLGYVRTQTEALIALDPAVRRDLPDAVHRMRVATRRLRSCLRTFHRVLDRRATDPLGAELKWLAAELGRDRDREVLHDRLTAALDALPRGLQPGPVAARLRTHDRAHRTGNRDRLTAVLDGSRHLALLDALDALLADPPLRPKAAEPAEPALLRAVRDDTRRVDRRIREALAAPPGEERDRALHEARKAAKRARYTAEAATPVLGGRARGHAQRITGLQDLLGDHQDSVQTRRALRDLAGQAHAVGEDTFTYGVLYAREENRAERCERRLPARWHTVTERTL
jgi:CHAD domain-containing protein